MATKAEVLGHIDCPVCGTKDGMRITADKNNAPFGYCEATCDMQLRIGGKVSRVNKFYELYPHIRKPGAPPAAVVPGAPSQEDAPATAADPTAGNDGTRSPAPSKPAAPDPAPPPKPQRTWTVLGRGARS